MIDMDAIELDESWKAHLKNSQHRLDASHAIQALRKYEAAQARIANAKQGG